jgi:uncharacterized integral membrane protein
MMTEEVKAEAKRGPSVMQRLKIVALAVLALLVLIVILQNTEAVETKILFATITVPKAVLLFGILIIGFILGVMAANRIFTKR